MSDEIRDTLELRYSLKDVVEIVSDFNKLYSSLDPKIRHFILTQPTFLNELRKQLKTDIGFLSPQKKDMALSIYGIIITEDIIKKYDAQYYAEDISALLEATDKKAVCTDDEFVGLLSSHVNSLKSVTRSMSIIIQNFIDLNSMNIEDSIIIEILVRRNLFNALSEVNLYYEVGEFLIDVRFIASIFAHTIEVTLQEHETIEKARSIGSIYQNLTLKYPLSEGEDLFYDLISFSILEPYYDKLKETFKRRIETKKKIIEEQISVAKQEFQIPIQPQKDQGRIEQILGTIEQPIFEIMKLRRDMNESKRRIIERNIELALRRMAMGEFGVQDMGDPQKYLKYLLDTWFSVFEEYPQMALPLIDIKQYTKYIQDPNIYIEENRQTIINQLQFKIRRHTGGERFTPTNLAKAFSMILFEILTNKTVLSLSFES
ncbi:MAG: hypothetical protein KAS63_00670 [Candidatus Heimdallarchaeota archaeon]|nr:hypothetical protein [Candidatus Heimdallarchaeota archaeon]MCK4953856.1 hypothetical protein [Candidatus Heimdallarchaeota archaeon]